MDKGNLCEADGGELCEVDDCKLATAHSRMPQLPPHFSTTFHTAKMFVFLGVPAKGEKAPTFPR